MSPRQALASALHAFILLAIFLGGVFCVSLSYLPHLKEELFKQDFTFIGLLFFVAASLLFLGFFALDRGKYLRIKMGGGKTVDVDVKVIQRTVEELFQARKISLQEVGVILGSKIEISVSMKEGEENKLEPLEKELELLLRQRFGYIKPFNLIVKS